MDVDWIEDMPKSEALDAYRKLSSFSWKYLRLVLEDPKKLQFKVNYFI